MLERGNYAQLSNKFALNFIINVRTGICNKAFHCLNKTNEISLINGIFDSLATIHLAKAGISRSNFAMSTLNTLITDLPVTDADVIGVLFLHTVLTDVT